MGMYTARIDPSEWMSKFGIDVDGFEQVDIIRRSEKYSDDKAKKFISWMEKEFGGVEPKEEVSAPETVAETAEEPAMAPIAAEVEAATAPAIVAEPEVAVDRSGLSADGRAINDPRAAPKPVGTVEITTGHPVLFKDTVAPAVVPSAKTVPRASNDPRGPIAAEAIPEAAAQG